MLVSDLEQTNTKIKQLKILSFDMNIYLVEVDTGLYQGLIRAPDGNPQRFHSVQQVKDELQNCQVVKAELVHESPYDEMVGNPPSADNKMVLPVTF